jgi:hypothetical protein
MSFDASPKKIIVPLETFKNLDADTKLSALILQRQGRLEIREGNHAITST